MRYRAAKASDGDLTPHDSVPTKLAAAVWDIVLKFKSTIPDYPQRETCELLILDRSVDQVHLSSSEKTTLPAKLQKYYDKSFCFALDNI